MGQKVWPNKYFSPHSEVIDLSHPMFDETDMEAFISVSGMCVCIEIRLAVVDNIIHTYRIHILCDMSTDIHNTWMNLNVKDSLFHPPCAQLVPAEQSSSIVRCSSNPAPPRMVLPTPSVTMETAVPPMASGIAPAFSKELFPSKDITFAQQRSETGETVQTTEKK